MELTNLTQFIQENLLILVVAIYVLGVFLKKMESVKDNYITVILMIFSITFSVLLNLINTEYSVMYKAIVNIGGMGVNPVPFIFLLKNKDEIFIKLTNN